MILENQLENVSWTGVAGARDEILPLLIKKSQNLVVRDRF